MALEIHWTKQADRKFDTIIEYMLHEWNQRITGSFVRKVYDTLSILAEFPEIGTLQHKEKGIRGFTVVKQINIFYKVVNNKLIVLDFFDNRQAPEKKRF
jgi:plasmid stabilization system protein ParE